MSGRRRLAAGNWKMHFVRADAERFGEALRQGLEREGAAAKEVDVALYASATLLAPLHAALDGSEIAVGGQDVHPEERGAFTGDLSTSQLLDVGCSTVLCGHSERRRDHGEGDALVARKARAAADAGLEPLVCLGETADERRAGRTSDVLARQLQPVLDAEPGRFALAYEPVWAIGTGDTATPEMAQSAHATLRGLLADQVGPAQADRVQILYGGSAKPANVADLLAGEDVDGFLVGGASLDVDDFLAIINVCAESRAR
ncbi:MAG: triose-phosphate isomerase [Acidobacteriota bacterium]